MIHKQTFKYAGRILKPSALTYMLRSYRYSVLARRAISINNEHAAGHYAQLSAANVRQALRIEARMLRNVRPIIRTFDKSGGFTYNRLVSRNCKPV